MNQLSTQKKKKPNPKFQNFLEAFKDTNNSSSKKAPSAAATGEDFDFESFLSQQENRVRQQERMRFESVRHEEQVIFSRQQQEAKLEIETLQIEIKKLAKEVGGTMVEAEKAAFQVVVSPGVYHKNFFERLIALIKLARKKVVESRTWMQMHNHRSQAKSAYWSGVKKGGTSFMLSSDRTVATQAG